MAQPPPYTSSADYSTLDSSIGAQLDVDMSALKNTLDALNGNIALIQNDDTTLGNASVHLQALNTAVLALMDSGWNLRGAWVALTAYVALDVVTNAGNSYLCHTAHTSGAVFSDTNWVLLGSVPTTTGTVITVTSAGINTAYTVNTGSAYAALAAVKPMIITWNVNSGVAPTLNVDGLGAVNIKKISSSGVKEAIAANDLYTTLPSIVVQDGADFIVLNHVDIPTSTSELGANVISKAVDYTILPADLVGYDSLIVLVDASLATRNITYPAPADYLGKTIIVIADVDPAGNSVITKLSGGTEHHTSYAKGDFIKGISDGANDNILDERVTAYGKIAKTADEVIALSTTTNPFDTDISVEKNVGGLFDAVTNFRINPGFAQRIKVNYGIYADNSYLIQKPNITGAYPFIPSYVTYGDINSFEFDLLSTDYLRPDIHNANTGVGTLYGVAGKTQTFFEWRVIKRIRT